MDTYDDDAAPVSGTPKVFGTLSIVFGSLLTLGGCLGSCTLAVPAMTDQMADELGRGGQLDDVAVTELAQSISQLYTGIGIQSFIIFGMSIWLLVLGIGQVNYKHWAIAGTKAWSIAAMVAVVLLCGIFIGMVGPGYEVMLTAIAKAPGAIGMPQRLDGMGSFMGASGALMTVLFYAPYPAIMFLFFRRDDIRSAMVN